MRANELFALFDWVENNRPWIMKDQPSLGDIRSKVEAELHCKCPESNIRASMERAEIPVRRSKKDSEVMLLKQQKSELEELVIELWNQANLPTEIAEKFRHRISGLTGRVLDVMKRQQEPADA